MNMGIISKLLPLPQAQDVGVSLENFSHAVQGDISTFASFQQLSQLFPKEGVLHDLSVR